MKCYIILEVLMLKQKWIVECDLTLTLQEVLSTFFSTIKLEIAHQRFYSEQMMIFDKYTGRMLHPFIPCNQLGLYNAILLTIV